MVVLRGETEPEAVPTLNEEPVLVGSNGSFEVWLEQEPGETPVVLGTCDAAGKGTQFMVGERVMSLTEALFSLEEPWRGRFLTLVANRATSGTWNSRQPTREEVAAWLEADLDLCREVTLLLNAWQRPRRCLSSVV
nr:hypothetical protein [Anaerolineae bacterium]